MKETNEISLHAVRVYRVLKESRWLSAQEIAALANIGRRTARAYAKRFTDLGIVDVAELWPGHRYRLSASAAKRNHGFLQRLEQASEILGQAATE